MMNCRYATNAAAGCYIVIMRIQMENGLSIIRHGSNACNVRKFFVYVQYFLSEF